MKHKTNYVTRITLALAAVFVMLLFQKPLTANAALPEHHLYPYQLEYAAVYRGDPEKTFSMMGKSYKYGVLKNDAYSEMHAEFNLEKKVDTVSFVVGHLDGANGSTIKLKIYLDGVYQESSMDLTGDMLTQKVTLNTKGAQKLQFVMTTGWGRYGIADIVQTSCHHYESEVTKIVTVKEDGKRVYTCTECGDSYTETIPKKQYCKPYLFPYQLTYMDKYDSDEGSDSCIQMMGVKYYQGVGKRDAYSEASILYNLATEYNSVTFSVGHMDGTNRTAATMTVYVDGVLVKTISLAGDMTTQDVTVSDLSSHSQLKIVISTGWGRYAVVNMSGAKKDTSNKAHSYEDEVTLEAQVGMTGIMTHRCTECGAFYTTVIPALTRSLKDSEVSVSLAQTTVTYNGKAQTPAVTVKYGSEELKKGTDYTVTYSKNKMPGYATVTIKGKGGYSGKLTEKFRILLAFTDVKTTDSYYDAVEWGFRNGIVMGKSNTSFAPSDGLTRGEFCTMLWRMFGKPDTGKMTCPFKDAKKSNHYKGILWCYNKGIINGYKDGTFKPSQKITRGNIIVMLFKLAKKESGFKAATIKNPFTDVKNNNKNISAYKWAYQYKITGDKTLRTAANCTRAEMVSFIFGYDKTYHRVE